MTTPYAARRADRAIRCNLPVDHSEIDEIHGYTRVKEADTFAGAVSRVRESWLLAWAGPRVHLHPQSPGKPSVVSYDVAAQQFVDWLREMGLAGVWIDKDMRGFIAWWQADQNVADLPVELLLANTLRLPMHPVDQHAVFARLEAQGHDAADLASRFAVSERVVRQRLALGRLAPSVLKAWRDGKIDEKVAQAFTLASGHEEQEAAWTQLRKGRDINEHDVRRLLTAKRPSAGGLPSTVVEAYLAAGGTITQSLFAEYRLIDDVAIFKQVVRAGLEAERKNLLGQGWAWVTFASDLPGRDWQYRWHHVHGNDRWGDPDEFDFTADEKRRLDEIERLTSELSYLDSGYDDLENEQQRIIQAANVRRFTPKERAASGVVIDDTNPNATFFSYGLLQPDDQGVPRSPLAGLSEGEPRSRPAGLSEEKERSPLAGLSEGEDNETEEEDSGPSIAGALLETITTSQTEAAREALLAEPKLALRFVVAALGARIWNSPVKIRIDADRSRPQPAAGEFDERLAKLADAKPDDLIAQLAELVALSLDLVARNVAAPRSAVDILVDHLPADAYLAAARRQFLAADYFKRASRAVALEALEEMAEAGAIPAGQVEALDGAKKTDVAALAASVAARCGWLPDQLRHPAYEIFSPSQEKAA